MNNQCYLLFTRLFELYGGQQGMHQQQCSKVTASGTIVAATLGSSSHLGVESLMSTLLYFVFYNPKTRFNRQSKPMNLSI